MSLAFLILAHHQPAHFQQLIRVISPAGEVFVHIDKKVAERPFRQAAGNARNVSFVERRHRIFYGGYSVVRATLELIDSALRSSPSASKLVLLSGDSYPIMTNRRIKEMLTGNTALLGHIQVRPESECDRHVLKLRYQDCSLLNDRIAGRSPVRALAAHVAQELIERLVQKGESPLPLFRGSQWWSLPRDMAEYCLKVSDSPAGKSLERYMKLTDACDEVFFQTLLLNSAHRERCLRIGPYMRNAGVMYSNFESNRECPALLDMRDLPVLRDCPWPFARKFDELRSSELREAIDRELLFDA